MKHRDFQVSLLKRASDRIGIRLAQAEEQGDAHIEDAVKLVDRVKKASRKQTLEAAVRGLIWDARRKGLRESLEIFREVLKEAQKENQK